MALIKIEGIQAGMVLQRDIKDRSGRMLLPAGASVTDKHLNVFRTWGITEAHVRGEKDGAEAAAATASLDDLDADLVARARDELTRLFSQTDREHPLMKELFTLAVARAAARLSRIE